MSAEDDLWRRIYLARAKLKARGDRDELERFVRDTVLACLKAAEFHVTDAKVSITGDLSAPCRNEPGQTWASNRAHAVAELQWSRDFFEEAEKLLRELGDR